MRVRLKGRDGGDVVVHINDCNFNPSTMTIEESDEE